ncbi:hypothetical protein Tco_0209413 [Tanacetum coccineum]
MGDEHLDTIPATESDEVIKSSVENLSDFLESFINRDTSIVHSSKIDPILEEFAGELAHIAPIPPGIVKVDFDPNDDISSDDDDFEDIEYVSLEEIDSIFDEFSLPRPPKESNSEYSDATIESLSPSPIPVEDSDPFMEEIDIFLASDDSTPPGVESDYDSEGDILLLEELLNDDLVPLAEYNHFTFDVEPDTSVKNDFDELNEDECFDPGGGENVVFLNVEEDDSFTFTIRTFLSFVTYPEVSPLLSSTKNEDIIFELGIST